MIFKFSQCANGGRRRHSKKCDYCGVDPRSVLFSHIIIFEMIFDEGHSMSSINLLKEYDYYGKTNVQP